MTVDRAEALRDLVQLRTPVRTAADRLKSFPWDSDVHVVVLTRADARRLLDSYVRGELTASAVEAWANAVEGRDDIGFELGFEGLLKQFLFDLATPELATPLTHGTATDWLSRLA